MIFRDPPSAALKAVVIAAVVSWLAIAVMHPEGCLSGDAPCLLASPAVLLYWAPAFLLAWIVAMLVFKALDPRQRVLPMPGLERAAETPLERSKGQAMLGAVVAAIVYALIRYGLAELASRLSGQPRIATYAVLGFLETWLGGIVVVAGLMALVIRVLQRVQEPLPRWDELR